MEKENHEAIKNEILTRTDFHVLQIELDEAIKREEDSARKGHLDMLANKLNNLRFSMANANIGLALLAPIPGSQMPPDKEIDVETDEDGLAIHYDDMDSLKEYAYSKGIVVARLKEKPENQTVQAFALTSWEQFASAHTFSSFIEAFAPKEYQENLILGFEKVTNQSDVPRSL